MICFCRGYGLCPDCDSHICSGRCICAGDGAPEAQAAAGRVNPSPARLEAWNQKLELTR